MKTHCRNVLPSSIRLAAKQDVPCAAKYRKDQANIEGKQYQAVDIITSGGSQNMKVQLDGTYDIYFDLANSQIYIMSEGKTPAEAE